VTGLLRLIAVPVWLLGTLILLVGYATQGAALDRGKLVVVQPLLVTTIVWALPLGYWLTSQHIAQNFTGSLHLARPCPSRAIFSLMTLSPATQGCGVMCRPLRVS